MKNKGILKFFAGLAIGIGFATNSIGIGIGIWIAFGAAFSQGKIVWGKNEKTNSTIMKLKDFIYNKKTKESNLLGVLFVIAVTIFWGAVFYYGFWIER